MTYAAPRAGHEAGPHWKAAAEGRLCLPFDPGSGAPVWPPGAAVLDWRACEPHGTIVAVSIVRRAMQPEWKEKVPYAVAMVRLDSGHRLFGNVVDCDPAGLHAGTRVTCRTVPTTDPTLGLVVFVPS